MPQNAQQNGYRTRRVVLKIRQGPYAGLSQIMGTTDELPPGQPTPTVTPEFTIGVPDGRGQRLALRNGTARLVRTTPTHIVYEEVTPCDKSSSAQPATES